MSRNILCSTAHTDYVYITWTLLFTAGILGPGWVQWMTAGNGVVHSEMPPADLLKKGGRMEGFQLWVNLPKSHKMIPPKYQDTPPERIPQVKTDDGKTLIKIIAGSALGT